ncbi:ICOS ligand-like isoform X2 [Onychostoma macrolepis]|uniref:ICOS ligand-like isoform X2 n=1 Tax=Onychostoma macrolepis TaxID=369639 RepID=UPI0027298D28|nr:ICOS ligand-like isoform X2 [Onychostoma macrolepis]
MLFGTLSHDTCWSNHIALHWSSFNPNQSWCSICVFAALINKVCLQVTVEAVIGGSVVLPCSSTELHLELQDINVLWRHNGSETIYDLIRGNDSVAGQNPRYKNRAKTFPDEYLRGNFSIKLINLQHTDAGQFSCFITHSSDSKQETVWLIINESTVEKASNSTQQANQEPEKKSTPMKKTSSSHIEGTVAN